MLRRHPILFAFLALIVLFAVWMVFQLTVPSGPIVVSKETTFITEPLDDDGLPDFAGYMLARQKVGVTPENNGAIPLLEAMWPGEIEVADYELICGEIGMAVPNGPGMKSPDNIRALRERAVEALVAQGSVTLDRDEVDPDEEAEELKFAAEERLERIFDFAIARPWKRTEWPWLAEWVDEHGPQFALLHEAARRPKFYAPSPELLDDPHDTWVNITLPVIQSLRESANCLSFRAMMRQGEGELAGAWEDIAAVYRLADHAPHDVLVSELVAIAMEGIAGDLVLQLLDDPGLSPELAREMLDFFKGRTPRNSMVTTIDEGERFGWITTIVFLSGERAGKNSRVGSTQELLTSDQPYLTAANDWNHILRLGNDYYDRMVAAANKPTWSQRQQALAAITAELDARGTVTPGRVVGSILSPRARSQMVGDWFAAMLMPTIDSALFAELRANTQRQLHLVAAALAVYRAEEGEYPETLNALVPELLEAVSNDLFTASPLAYRRTKDGYLLHSLGSNGVDDGGSSAQFQVYEGYDIDESTDAVVRQLLGKPRAPADEQEAIRHAAPPPTLVEEIPAGADDLSVRLPLLRLKLNLPEE